MAATRLSDGLGMGDWQRRRNAQVQRAPEGEGDVIHGGASGDALAGGAGRDRVAKPPTPKPLPVVGAGARRLLDLIARAEGTSGKVRAQKGYASDYDVTFGYGAAEPPGRRKPLSRLSLDE